MNSTTGHIFANRKTLIVTMAEIKSLLPMDECIRLQKVAFEANARGEAVNAPNTWLRLPGQNRWMKLLAGYVAESNSMGMKVLARFPKNPPGMNIGSIVALFDPDDGFPLAIMDGVYFTAIRTAAAGGLSALYCARKNSSRIGILGAGVQARFNLVAIKQLMPQIVHAAVFSRSVERRQSFAWRMEGETGIEMAPVETVAEAVADADIILTATNSPEPVLTPELVRPGVHIVAVGIKTEIHPSVLKKTRVIADGKEIAKEDGKFSVALKAAFVSESDLQVELGDIISGKVPGRLNDEEVTLFDSSGLAIQDVICAHHVYEKARSLGKGTWVDLGLGEYP